VTLDTHDYHPPRRGDLERGVIGDAVLEHLRGDFGIGGGPVLITAEDEGDRVVHGNLGRCREPVETEADAGGISREGVVGG
jgi:hypothetical protein